MAIIVYLEAQECQAKSTGDDKLHARFQLIIQFFIIHYQRNKHCIDNEVLVERLPIAHLDSCTEAAAIGHEVIQGIKQSGDGEKQHQQCSAQHRQPWEHFGQQADTDNKLSQNHQHGQHQGKIVQPSHAIDGQIIKHLVFRAQRVDTLGETAENEQGAHQKTANSQCPRTVFFAEHQGSQ